MFSVDYSMTGRYSDFEELRPTGEASHIPDAKLNEGCDGELRRQRVATSTGRYLEEPTQASGECRSCGASIWTEQTKCRFCLTNHLGGEATSTDESTEATLLGIIHLVVKSSTFYGAVAKGGAAANLLTFNEAEAAVDDYTLIYDLDETPALQLADRWPSSLPDDKVWLVPAMALTETAGGSESDRQRPSGPMTEHLNCQNSGEATDHQFKTHESVPDET